MLGRIELLTETDCDRLQSAAFRILDTIGCRVLHEDTLKAMAAMGCKVDFAAQTARIPEHVLIPIIEGQVAAPGRLHRRTHAERSADSYSAMFFHSATHLLDWKASQKRLATIQDAIDMIRLADATPEVRHVTCAVVPSEVNPKIESLYEQVLLARNTRDYAAARFRLAALAPYFAELGRILNDDESSLMSAIHFVKSPLTITRNMCELVSHQARYGMCYESGTQTTAGSTSPITAAGTVALAVAEILAGWVVARAIVPGIELYGLCCTAVLDIYTGSASFSSPESVLQDASIAELFEKRFGGRTRGAGASYIGAKVPGIQAASERAFKTMALGAMTGWFVSAGAGMLDNGQVFCPTQAMLDIDYGKMLWQFNRGIDVSDDKIGLDGMSEIMFEGHSPFLNSAHTARYFHESLWLPELFSRSPLVDAKADSDRVLAAADARWRDTLASYVPFELDPDKDAAMSEVLARAEAELL